MGDPKYFRKFYARRTLRIFPLYYGLLLVLFALTPLLKLHWDGRWWVWLLYLQFTIPVNAILSSHIDITHLWSLAIEEQFYLLWPLAVFLLKGLRRITIAAIVLSLGGLACRLVLCYPHPWVSVRYYMPCELDALLIGGTAALLLRSKYRPVLLRWAPAIFFFGLAPLGRQVWVGRLDWRFSSFTDTFGFTFLAIASTGLLLWSVQGGTIASRCFSWSPLRFAGRYSYGIYVIHSMLRALLRPVMRGLMGLGLGYGVSAAVAVCSVAGLAVLLAFLSYQFYEAPFLRLKRYFRYSRGNAGPAERLS